MFTNLDHLQLCILCVPIRPSIRAQLAFGLHGSQPAIETLELLLHLSKFGQTTVQLSTGLSQLGLVKPPLLLKAFQGSFLYLGQTPRNDQFSAQQQRVEESLALRAVQLQLLSVHTERCFSSKCFFDCPHNIFVK